jgi:hypothetical protein
MKADDLTLIVSYFAYIPKTVSGVHVGIKDTEGPAILVSERDLDTRNQIYF